ncbi:hypothetical protein AQBE111736_08050 [Aquirufa beregesia]|nr:hypothetical protein [Aquirufa beregesia]
MKKIELTPQVEAKETWTKPELEMVSVKENTLAGAGVGVDIGIFS